MGPRRFEYQSGGALVVHAFNDHGVQSSKTTYEPGGVARRRHRSQVEQIDGCYRRRYTYNAARDPVERWCIAPTNAVVIDDQGCELRRLRRRQGRPAGLDLR